MNMYACHSKLNLSFFSQKQEGPKVTGYEWIQVTHSCLALTVEPSGNFIVQDFSCFLHSNILHSLPWDTPCWLLSLSRYNCFCHDRPQDIQNSLNPISLRFPGCPMEAV